MTWRPAEMLGFGPDAGHFLESEGVRLHYLDGGGDGRPVIFVHGINQNLRTWEMVLPHLRGPYRLILVDQRGHGQSERPGVAYQKGDLLRDLRALISALGLQRTAVVGHSLGGWVGMNLAGHFPDLVSGLVVGDMAPNVGAESTPENRRAMLAALAPGAGDISWAGEDEAYAYLRQAAPAEGEAEVRARMRQQLRRRADGRLERARSPRVAQSILAEVYGANLWPLLPKITCPVLLVQGEHSDVLKREVAEHMVRTFPNARLVVIKGSYHNLQLFQPAAFGVAIDAFLRGLA